MLRRYVGTRSVGVADDSVNQLLTGPGLLKKLRRFPAVLFGPLLEVDVVEQARQSPEIRTVSVTQLPGVPRHDALQGQGVEDMEGLLVVPAQQSQRLFSGVQHDGILLMFILVIQSVGCQSLPRTGVSRRACPAGP